MEPLIIVGAASALTSALFTYLLTTHYRNKMVAASPAGEDHVLDLRLEREFQKGKEAGRSEELGNFTLTYEPFVETIEEYMGLKKRSTLGYHMQIHYAGFPIGHQTRYVTHNSIEYDEKRVDALLNNEVAAAVNGIVQLAATKGMNAKALPKIRK
ncbi:hypothetical protein [Aquilutibacter rugosus]|uniref:hypothetical protein n=1 Tax=Aquilutibacter rugosus TaxID=3115820 RepID=UPI002F402D9D